MTDPRQFIIESFLKENNTLTYTNVNLKEENRILKERNEFLEIKVCSLNSCGETLNKFHDMNLLQDRLNLLITKVDALEDNNETLQRLYDELVRENTALIRRVRVLEHQVKEGYEFEEAACDLISSNIDKGNALLKMSRGYRNNKANQPWDLVRHIDDEYEYREE